MQNLALAIGLALFTMLPSAGLRAATEEEETLQEFRFRSIDGGEIGFRDWTDRPVLVVNTASLCGFTPQLADLQALWETYGERGLVVLAVPSDSFRQELGSEKEVSEFCTIQYGITLPMTAITPVTGEEAHPFFAWLRDDAGFEPRWNFNKVLLGRDGRVLGTWGSGESPTGPEITGAIEAALAS
jgi:glutathione peroxidase